MATLYVMIGVPGSGKSTFIQQHVKGAAHVSRDQIRFSIINDTDDYFAKEKKVFKQFCQAINFNLAEGRDVYADATHITKGSRRKLLSNVRGYDKLEAIYINTSLDNCIKHNNFRDHNTRAYVPESVIKDRYKKLEAPSLDEGFSMIHEIIY